MSRGRVGAWQPAGTPFGQGKVGTLVKAQKRIPNVPDNAIGIVTSLFGGEACVFWAVSGRKKPLTTWVNPDEYRDLLVELVADASYLPAAGIGREPEVEYRSASDGGAIDG